MDSDLGIRRDDQPELRKNLARPTNDAATIARPFVPRRRRPQQGPRIARAQRADDHVVELRRILADYQPGEIARSSLSGRLHPVHSYLFACSYTVGEQTSLVLGIGPGPGHHAGAAHRTDVVIPFHKPSMIVG